MRGDGRGVGLGAGDEENEVSRLEEAKEAEKNRVGMVLVAQPLLAVRVLQSPTVREFPEAERTAQPGVAVLLKLF
jgi:hypothetical protein